jgi:hypothetical protein
LPRPAMRRQPAAAQVAVAAGDHGRANHAAAEVPPPGRQGGGGVGWHVDWRTIPVNRWPSVPVNPRRSAVTAAASAAVKSTLVGWINASPAAKAGSAVSATCWADLPSVRSARTEILPKDWIRRIRAPTSARAPNVGILGRMN